MFILRMVLYCVIVMSFSAANAEMPDLLLLKKYQVGIPVTGWLMSEKLDGVRAYWNGKQLLSRQGNPFIPPDWFIKDFPPFELDGELWIKRGAFEQTVSIVSRDKAGSDWAQITYHIFEVPNQPGGLLSRLGYLQDYLHTHPVSQLTIIPQIPCRGNKHLQSTLNAIVDKGGEGLVVRRPDTAYETGRSSNALKVKVFDDMEGRVIAYKQGKGKYKGMVGALLIELDNHIQFYIGTGLSDAQRQSPPEIGRLITFKYYGFTQKGVPRFASFLRIRDQ